jgi:hypothetical protein
MKYKLKQRESVFGGRRTSCCVVGEEEEEEAHAQKNMTLLKLAGLTRTTNYLMNLRPTLY